MLQELRREQSRAVRPGRLPAGPARKRGEKARPAALTCGADGEDHLYRVEEEEHDEQGDRGADGQEERLCGVDGLNTCRTARAQLGGGGTPPPTAQDSLLLVLLLLNAPVVVGLPSLSFSWFSQSMFNDLRGGRDRTAREISCERNKRGHKCLVRERLFQVQPPK